MFPPWTGENDHGQRNSLLHFKQLHRLVEVRCLRHPGASTIGSQLQDADSSHSWQNLATQPRASRQERETGTRHTE